MSHYYPQTFWGTSFTPLLLKVLHLLIFHWYGCNTCHRCTEEDIPECEVVGEDKEHTSSLEKWHFSLLQGTDQNSSFLKLWYLTPEIISQHKARRQCLVLWVGKLSISIMDWLECHKFCQIASYLNIRGDVISEYERNNSFSSFCLPVLMKTSFYCHNHNGIISRCDEGI